MTKYTADDFANAKFAEHPNPDNYDGTWAVRAGYEPHAWLLAGVPGNTDEAMASDGWVPVPTKPWITESRLRELTKIDRTHGLTVRGVLQAYGVEIIPDPEPTDEELLAGIIRNIDDWQSITSPELLAKYLNTAGVTPPNVKGN